MDREKQLSDLRDMGISEMVMHSPLPMLVTGTSGKIEGLNKRFTGCFGWTIEELPTLDVWWKKFFPDEEYRGMVQLEFAKCLAEGSESASVHRYAKVNTAGGNELQVEYWLSQHGETRSMIFEDQTEKQQMQAEHGLFRKMLDHSNDSIFVIDSADGRILDVNRTACEAYGYNRKEFLQMGAIDLIARFPKEKGWQIFFKEMIQRDMRFISALHLRKDGSTFSVEASISILETIHGVRILAVVRDVSDRLVTEREQSRFLRNVLECLTTPFFIVKMKTRRVVLANQAAQMIMYRLDDILCPISYDSSGTAGPACRSANFNSLECAFHSLQIRQEPSVMEHDYKDRKGISRTEMIFIYPFFSIDGVLDKAIVYIHDITEQKKSEAELLARERQLKKVNRDLEHFSFALSHDLKEPLRQVLIFSDLLQNDMGNKLQGEQKDWLGQIDAAARNMKALLKSVHSWTGIRGNMSFESISMDDVLAEALLRNEHLQSLKEQVQVESPLGRACGNFQSLVQLFQNLLSNAWKYRSNERELEIVVRSEVVGSNIELVVQDNGIGIDIEYRKKIFSPFSRLHSKDQYEGTGLGLSICRRIVDALGGSIRVDEPDKPGSLFCVTLPLESTAVAQTLEGE